MDVEKVGKAISYLRKRAGYTQKDLADRIGISDKAVSKWERGLGLPEIGYLQKLSILLDTDTDSLLAGDVVHHDSSWMGLIMLGENRYGIGLDTIIYDKPLIYFLLSYFLLMGIRDITVFGTETDRSYLQGRFGDGRDYGFRMRVLTDSLEDVKTSANNLMIVYGRCILYGVDQTRFFQKAMVHRDRFTMLVLPKKLRSPTAHVIVDENKKVISSGNDAPLRTQYDFSDIPIVFAPAALLPQIASKKDMRTFISQYADKHDVYVHMLDRGFVDVEVENWQNVQEASLFMRIVQEKCGMNVYCIEEVAWRRGLISTEELQRHGERQAGTEYGEYILSLCERVRRSRTES